MKKIIVFLLFSNFVFTQNIKKTSAISFDKIRYELLKKSDTIYIAYDGASTQSVIKSFLKNGQDSRMYSFIVSDGYAINFNYIENSDNKLKVVKIKKKYIKKHKKIIVDNLLLKQLEAGSEKFYSVFKDKVIFVIDYKELKSYPVQMSYLGRDD